MDRQAKSAAYGLLTGIGEGILLKAKNKREDFETRQAEARQFARDQRNLALNDAMRGRYEKDRRTYEEGREDDRRIYESGLFSKTVQGKDNMWHGVSGTGETKPLGIEGHPPSSYGYGGATSQQATWDRFIMQSVIEGKTQMGPEGKPIVDMQSVAEHLRIMPNPRPELADLVDDFSKTTPVIEVGSEEHDYILETTTIDADQRNPRGLDSWQPDAMKEAYGLRPDGSPQTEQGWIDAEVARKTGRGGSAPGDPTAQAATNAAPDAAAPQAATPGGAGQYNSAEEVKIAMDRGDITFIEAMELLNQFGPP